MKFFYLDAGIASVSDLTVVALLFILGVSLVEWIVMLLFKFNDPGKSLFHSFIVNLVSAVLGFLLADTISSVTHSAGDILQWIIYFGLTVVVEAILLQLLNRHKTLSKIWTVAFIMNLVSYLILFLWVRKS
jgi:hypothetical protein